MDPQAERYCGLACCTIVCIGDPILSDGAEPCKKHHEAPSIHILARGVPNLDSSLDSSLLILRFQRNDILL